MRALHGDMLIYNNEWFTQIKLNLAKPCTDTVCQKLLDKQQMKYEVFFYKTSYHPQNTTNHPLTTLILMALNPFPSSEDIS